MSIFLNFYEIENQTPELCLLAVQKCGYNIDYVKKLTPDLVIEAMKQTNLVIQIVKGKIKWGTYRFNKIDIIQEASRVYDFSVKINPEETFIDHVKRYLSINLGE